VAARVISVEIVPGLVVKARENLKRARRDGNVTVVQGDGSIGYVERSPYDAISVAAGAPEVPQSLLQQLRDPGRLTIPVGGFEDQELQVIWKRGGRIETRVATQCRFVPLRGGEGWR
jgi:protein-L-isoaspartate(D-aspartate) O-methyltransferase